MNSVQKIHFILFLIILSAGILQAGVKLKLVILHTNDTHSQVEPTAKSGLKTSDMGGYARRMGVIDKIRSEEKNVLLLDAGDFSQGTPYYNFYNGRIEVDAMNRMKYDAVTLGNHEFDNGIDTLAVILGNANFPIISSNYELKKTPLSGMVQPYRVLERGGLRIGILALNINPEGLIIENNYKGVEYLDPFEKASEMAGYLRKSQKCDVVICLSHLGADTTKTAVNDFAIVRKTRFIDVIIGGHSHNIITDTHVKNLDGKPVVLAQMGKSGLFLGRIDLVLQKKNAESK